MSTATAAALRRNPRSLFRRLLSTATATRSPGPSTAASRLKSAIRSQRDPDRLAALFISDEAAAAPAFRADRFIYHSAVTRLAAAGRHDLVHRVVSTILPPDPSEGFLIRAITLYGAAGMPDAAAAAFDRRPASPRLVCALLNAFRHCGLRDRLRDAFDRASADGKLVGVGAVACYNVLLSSLCAEGNVAAARLLLDEMPRKNLKPDIISYNEVLHGYIKVGDDAGFDELLMAIYHNQHLKPNSFTYNLRMLQLCAQGLSFMAAELLDVMAAHRVTPNGTCFGTVIGGLCKEKRFETALDVINRMETVPPRDRTPLLMKPDSYAGLVKWSVENGQSSRVKPLLRWLANTNQKEIVSMLNETSKKASKQMKKDQKKDKRKTATAI